MTRYTINELNQFGRNLAKKIALDQGITRRPHPGYRDLVHPECKTEGCTNTKIVLDWHWTSGKPLYRPVCQSCHDINTAKRYAEKTGASWVKNVSDVCAHKQGFNSTTEWLNSKHPYRQYRKDFCENTDGRLGHPCTTTIVFVGQLDTHHVVPKSKGGKDDPTNLWTLCKCCHALAHKDQVQIPALWD